MVLQESKSKKNCSARERTLTGRTGEYVKGVVRKKTQEEQKLEAIMENIDMKIDRLLVCLGQLQYLL